MKVLAIFTCFNRKEKTVNCIKTLVSGNKSCKFTFVVADDNSLDGTRELLQSMKQDYGIHLLKGNGQLFYSGGMRMGMDYALQKLPHDYDYLLMMNDDVDFYANCIDKMIVQSKEQDDSVVVGVMQNGNGEMSYSGVINTKRTYFEKVSINDWEKEVDTFNANCVLIPYDAFIKTGSIDPVYVHSLGDFDYGLSLKRNGFKLHVSKEYVGKCDNNSIKGTWTDTTLSRRERIKKKESPKGAPTKQWFHFLKKNFGFFTAVRGVFTPYLRILIKR